MSRFYLYVVSASAKVYGKSYARVFLRNLSQVRFTRACKTSVMGNRLNTVQQSFAKSPRVTALGELADNCFALSATLMLCYALENS